MVNYSFRSATLNDIDFIVYTIFEAEKSGTNKLVYTTLFNLTKKEVRRYISQILKEEIDGCEFSITSFIIAHINGKVIAAAGGWLEGMNESELPSAILKANLISYYFPKESMLYASDKSEIIRGIKIERNINTYQIEYVYVDKRYRGQNIARLLIDQHIQRCRNLKCKIMEVQLSANNKSALACYQKSGFEIIKIFKSTNNEILNYLPFNQKILMQKIIE
jgi:GNAT superfamily N-acetyltransferase